jgi:ADP-heptose:LPS heptosyltransferase
VVLLKLARKIRKLNIDLVINITALRSMRADQRDRMFFKACGVKQFIGFEQKAEEFEVAIDTATGQYEWEADRLKRKIAVLGKIDLSQSHFWDLKLSSDEEAKASNLLSPLPDGAKFIAINAGTKMGVKDWGQRNWLTLLNNCADEYSDYHLVAVGAPEDADFSAQCLDAWNNKGLNLCGKGSPRVSAAVLKKAELFLGHDSGPMHLAGAVGTPSVAVFSCINQPGQWFPRGDQNRLIFPETACARNKSKECTNPAGYCVKTVSPKIVQQELEKFFNSVSHI